MIAKSIQFNRRNAMSLLLAGFMLALAVTPALAWFEEGEVNGQAARPCRFISDGQGIETLYCFQVTPHHARPIAERPVVHPAITRAEQMFIFNQDSTQPLVQSNLDQ